MGLENGGRAWELTHVRTDHTNSSQGQSARRGGEAGAGAGCGGGGDACQYGRWGLDCLVRAARSWWTCCNDGKLALGVSRAAIQTRRRRAKIRENLPILSTIIARFSKKWQRWELGGACDRIEVACLQTGRNNSRLRASPVTAADASVSRRAGIGGRLSARNHARVAIRCVPRGIALPW